MANFIKPCAGRITSHFQKGRLNPVTKKIKDHKGIDFGADGDGTIIAAAAGTVRRVGVRGEFGGYGNTVIITHSINGKKYETLYAHLASVNVHEGQVVKQGQKIGMRGSTGNSTGPHLHFEIHDPVYAPGQPNAIDPYPLLQMVSNTEVKKEEKKVEEQPKLTAGQEKVRKEAMELGLTDGKDPFRQVNQFYVWEVVLGLAKEVKKLRDEVNKKK